MFDTCACISLLRGKEKRLIDRVTALWRTGLCMSSITLAELEFGAFKSAKPIDAAQSVKSLQAGIPFLPFDERAARHYGYIRAALETRGAPIGPLDTLIAAHARSAGLILVTQNTREFQRVPDLRVEDWTAAQ
jgi:tRNA(fMet)-specific endonuclease VapC